jgi:outer membrane protein TolC
MEDGLAIGLALENRLDLRTAIGRVEDAQRGVIVAADALQAGVDLVASGTFGERRSVSSADQSNAQLRPERGFYGASLLIDLPWERTRERNTYRNSLIALEQSARDVQDIEDSIKAAVRDGLRSLLQARETYTIQEQAERLADRRVESTNILLEAGRAEIRDLLEAQEALLSAQNTRTAALVTYRISALELQRDLGVLQVDETGLWKEYRPDEQQPRP